ncbi:unnamed protein product [Rhodiola kirilowii]
MSEARIASLICLALLAISAAAHPTTRLDVPGPDEKIFNVLEYGAKMDIKTDNGPNFNKAWQAACHSNAKARLVIPKGVFYTTQVNFQGPCTTKGPIIVQLQGTVKADTDSSNFPNMQWIAIEYVDNMIFLGTGGLLDGQGAASWFDNDCDTNPDCTLPASNVYIYQSSNIFVRNLNSINPKGYNFQIDGSSNIKLRRLRLSAPKDSPNTDGFHITNSTLVKIAKSVISSGGDCASFGAGSNNVAFERIICNSGTGISIGYLGKSENELEVKNITVKNITLSDTEYGLRFKTWVTPYPNKAHAIKFEDITMTNVKNPIFVNQELKSEYAKAKASHVKISDVHFVNITGTTTSEAGVTFKCSQEAHCAAGFDNISLKNSISGKIVTCVKGVKSLVDVFQLVLGNENCS